MVSPNWKQLEAMLAQMSHDQREQLISRAQRLQQQDDTLMAESSTSDRQHAAWARLWNHMNPVEAEGDNGTVVSRDYRQVLYGRPGDEHGSDQTTPPNGDAS